MVAQCFPSQHSEAVRKSGVALGAPVQSELQVKPCVKKLLSIFFIVFLIIFFHF